MKDKVLEGLEKVVLDMQEEGRWPERIVISGHSMGGGMSA
jgi:acetyl esterase/lipase